MTDLAGTLSRGLAGRYRVERELGRGGMATVFFAEDLRYHRPVAVKVLLPELASAVGSERFLREIRIAAGLRHPHILPVLDAGEVEGLPFYVMPFVEGESLKDKLLREKQLPIPETIQIGREVADALNYAHERGVVHRDIKPANILLDSGHAVVADFGIALATQHPDSHRLTATGVSPGSPHYMSPEQAAGEGELDGRSDIYSLGCVLYEALVGDPPFMARMPQAILARKLAEPPPGVRTARETVPPALEQVITRSLARSPADRFRTARELGGALEAVAAGRPVDTDPGVAPWDGATQRPAFARWAAVAGVIAAATLGITSAVGFVNTRIYDLKLGIPADFTPTRTDFPIVGLQALVPVLFYAFAALLAYVILSHTWRLASMGLRRAPRVGDTLEALRRSTADAWRGAVASLSSTAVADLFFVGVVVAGLLALAPFRELVSSLWSEATEALSPSSRDLQQRYAQVLTLVIMVLLLAWRGVFRHLRGRGPLGIRVLVSKWGSFACILLLLMAVTGPWLLLWSNAHERVILEGERGYILVETESELVIFRPGSGPARRYVKGEHLELERLGTMGYPFETQEWFEQVRSGGNVPEIDP